MELNEKNVAQLAVLLKKPESDVTKALETEGGFETLVSDYNTNNQVFGIDDFAKLKSNLKKETIANLEEGDIPDSFKNKAVGWKLESLEKEIKDKYQFTDEFKGLSDLVDKVITKTGNPSNNGEETQALKDRIVEMETEFKDKLNQKQNEFDTTLIQTDFNKAVNSLGLDYEDEVLKKQKGLLKAAFNNTYQIKRIDGATVVLKGDDVIKDNKFDPLPLKDVVLSFTKDYGFQLKAADNGGHGGNSSKKKAGLQGTTFKEYLENNNVKPNTNESDKLYPEWKAAQQ